MHSLAHNCGNARDITTSTKTTGLGITTQMCSTNCVPLLQMTCYMVSHAMQWLCHSTEIINFCGLCGPHTSVLDCSIGTVAVSTKEPNMAWRTTQHPSGAGVTPLSYAMSTSPVTAP